jgi:hypothetical protein
VKYLQDVQVEKTHAERMTENATALDITYHNMRNKRTISVDHVESDIDKQWLHVSKTMLQSPELKAISTHYHHTSKFVASKSVQSLFRRGVFLVPNVMLAEVSDYLERRIEELVPLVEAFVNAYPKQIEAAREKLGDAFDETNYPPADALYDAFGIDYRWVSIGTPGAVNGISRAIYLREQARVQAQFEQAATILITGMREQALKMVKALTERLQTLPGEKKKTFKDVTINRLQEWAHNYLHGISDVVYDEKLKPVAETVLMLTDVDPKDLRKDDVFRQDVAVRMGEVEETLEKLIIEKPTRAIVFE